MLESLFSALSLQAALVRAAGTGAQLGVVQKASQTLNVFCKHRTFYSVLMSSIESTTFSAFIRFLICFFYKKTLEESRLNNWFPSELINDADFNSIFCNKFYV